MQQLSINVKQDKIRESKKKVKEELVDNPIIIKKIRDLNCSEKEFDDYLGYFLAYLEDKTCCDKCKNPKKCPKQFDGIAMDLYRSEYGIERKFSLCPSRELERTIALNYLIRDFPNSYLSLSIDDIDTSYNKYRDDLETVIFKTDIDNNYLNNEYKHEALVNEQSLDFMRSYKIREKRRTVTDFEGCSV